METVVNKKIWLIGEATPKLPEDLITNGLYFNYRLILLKSIKDSVTCVLNDLIAFDQFGYKNDCATRYRTKN